MLCVYGVMPIMLMSLWCYICVHGVICAHDVVFMVLCMCSCVYGVVHFIILCS